MQNMEHKEGTIIVCSRRVSWPREIRKYMGKWHIVVMWLRDGVHGK